MTPTKEIPGIDESSLRLLEAVGVGSAEELALQDPERLVAELQRANAILSMNSSVPETTAVAEWIALAKESAAKDTAGRAAPEEHTPGQPEPVIGPPVNYEVMPEVAEMLARAPRAIPLPGKILMERGVRVSDVPAGLLLNRYSGDLDLRTGDPSAPKADALPPRRIDRVEPAPRQGARRPFDPPPAKQITPSADGTKRVPASIGGNGEDRIALIRSPLEATNRGKDPDSRRYIRGVLHTHPWQMRCGAFFALLLIVNMPLAIVSGFLLLASREFPEALHWVPEWILAFPIALPLTALGYLIWGVSGKCRICTQKLFVHRAALKHIKAHRLPGLGYVVPLCLHLLAFNWFRCSSCGTPVRLRK